MFYEIRLKSARVKHYRTKERITTIKMNYDVKTKKRKTDYNDKDARKKFIYDETYLNMQRARKKKRAREDLKDARRLVPKDWKFNEIRLKSARETLSYKNPSKYTTKALKEALSSVCRQWATRANYC